MESCTTLTEREDLVLFHLPQLPFPEQFSGFSPALVCGMVQMNKRDLTCFEKIFHLWKSFLFHLMPGFLYMASMLRALPSLQVGDGTQQHTRAQAGTLLWSSAGYRILSHSDTKTPVYYLVKKLRTVHQLHKPDFGYNICPLSRGRSKGLKETTGSCWLMVPALNFYMGKTIWPVMCFSHVLWWSPLKKSVRWEFR